MIAKLILTHGPLGDELLAAARTITRRELPGFKALCLDWEDGFDEARERAVRALAELRDAEGVLILTDMFGGTPYNVARTLCEPGRIEVVTGVNVPIVLRLACTNGAAETLEELVDLTLEKGRRSISRATPSGTVEPPPDDEC